MTAQGDVCPGGVLGGAVQRGGDVCPGASAAGFLSRGVYAQGVYTPCL